jgi:hypothetical protein
MIFQPQVEPANITGARTTLFLSSWFGPKRRCWRQLL